MNSFPQTQPIDEYYVGPVSTELLTVMERVNGGRLLDAGCGLGHKTDAFRQMGFSACGIDLDPLKISVAQTNFPHNEFIVGGVEHLPFAENTFDMVFSCSVLQYVDHHTTLAEYARVLRPGGQLVLLENLRNNPITRSARLAYKRMGGHYPPTTTPKRHVESNLPCLVAGLFQISDTRFFNLTTPVVPVLWEATTRMGWRQREYCGLYAGLRAVDAVLLTLLPILNRLCWTIYVAASRR